MERIVIPPRGKQNKSSELKKEPEKPKKEEVVVEEKDIEEVEESEADKAAREDLESFESSKKEEEPKVLRTEEIDLDQKGANHQTKTKVNFVNKDFMSGFVKQKTEESKPKEEAKSSTDGKTAEEIREQIKQEEASGSTFTREELQDFADTAMDVLDMLLSTGLRFYAKDSSTTAYELPVDKKRKLTRQLTNIFIKYQMKFSIEFMFIITLFICYSVPARKAHQNRKQLSAGPAQVKEGTTQTKRSQGRPTK